MVDFPDNYSGDSVRHGGSNLSCGIKASLDLLCHVYKTNSVVLSGRSVRMQWDTKFLNSLLYTQP